MNKTKIDDKTLINFVKANHPTAKDVSIKFNCSIVTAKRHLSLIGAKATRRSYSDFKNIKGNYVPCLIYYPYSFFEED